MVICIVAKKPKEFYHIDLNGNQLYSQKYYFGFNYDYDIAKVVTDMPDPLYIVVGEWILLYTR